MPIQSLDESGILPILDWKLAILPIIYINTNEQTHFEVKRTQIDNFIL